MSKQPVRRKSLGRTLLKISLFLIMCGIVSAFMIPRILVQQATQKPSDSGTFVTRETQSQTEVLPQSETSTQDSIPTTPEQAAPANSFQERIQRAIEQASQAQASTSHSQGSSSSTQTSNTETNEESSLGSHSETQIPPDSPSSEKVAPESDGKFRVQMSESEISNLLYSGLIQGTAPEYQAAIQGVSTRIQSGRAKITVALIPQHLPEAFLKNLPGVSRQTPTVYVGGEMSLIGQGQSVIPVIHELSLGNFKVPIPFLQAAIKDTVQQQTNQMMTLPNGKQARLEKILLENGAMTLVGQVN